MESLLRDLNALKCKIIETVTFWLKLATEGPESTKSWWKGFKHVNTFFGDQPPYINLLKIYNTAIY